MFVCDKPRQYRAERSDRLNESDVTLLTALFLCFRRIINDSLRTDIPLLYPPYLIALGQWVCSSLSLCVVCDGECVTCVSSSVCLVFTLYH